MSKSYDHGARSIPSSRVPFLAAGKSRAFSNPLKGNPLGSEIEEDNEIAYVAAGGRETSVCGQGEIFTLQDNTLSTDGLWVSAPPKTSWTRFAVSAPTGEMVTNFTLVDGYLTWSNQAFDGGVANFCAINKIVLAVYNGTAPTDCVPVKLLAIQTSTY